MPYGGIVNNGLYRVSSATASVQRVAAVADAVSSAEVELRTVGMTKLVTTIVQSSGALLGTVVVQVKVANDAAPGWFDIDSIVMPALNATVHRAYDIPGYRVVRLRIDNPLGAGAAVYSYMLGAGI